MKGFKGFDKDLKCRGFQYEVGKTYAHDGALSICATGFHFCATAFDIYNYYSKESDTRICEVIAHGEVVTDGDKSCTNKIEIVRELSTKEVLELWIKRTNSGYYNSGDRNSGYYNSGYYNSGDRNSGYYNSGDRNSGNYNSGNYNSGYYNSGNYNSGYYNSGYYNSGDRNSGYYNSGDRNSGYYNSGNYNSGDRNSGDRNSGNYNSGNYNSGNYNSGNYNSGNYNSGNYNSGNYNSGNYNSGYYNSGYYNSNTPFVRLFNRNSKLRWDDPKITRLNRIFGKVKPILRWVFTESMTEEEKAKFPSHKTTGGFLKNTGRNDWSDVTAEDYAFIKTLPNFDAKVFKDCTGVEL